MPRPSDSSAGGTIVPSARSRSELMAPSPPTIRFETKSASPAGETRMAASDVRASPQEAVPSAPRVAYVRYASMPGGAANGIDDGAAAAPSLVLTSSAQTGPGGSGSPTKAPAASTAKAATSDVSSKQ
eukprot:5668004-Prymnesium_polylepis.1